MEEKLAADRQSRDIGNPRIRARQWHIDRLQKSYGYDAENAEKVFEIMQVRQVEFMFGSALGAVAAYKVGPIQKLFSESYVLMRKPWMRFPMQIAAFGVAYYCGCQIPPRVLRKFTTYNSKRGAGVDSDTYKGENDLVGRFRLHENNELYSKEDDTLNYLSMYAKDPLTKPQLVEQMMKSISK